MKWIHLIYIFLALSVLTVALFIFHPWEDKQTSNSKSAKRAIPVQKDSLNINGSKTSLKPNDITLVGNLEQNRLMAKSLIEKSKKMNEGHYNF